MSQLAIVCNSGEMNEIQLKRDGIIYTLFYWNAQNPVQMKKKKKCKKNSCCFTLSSPFFKLYINIF